MDVAIWQTPEHPPAQPENFRLLRRLGEGGFGEVYEAWDERLCRSVALKRLKASVARLHPDRLVAEGRLAASFSHPAFVQIYGIDDHGGAQSIVMELVHGSTLRQFALQKPQTEAQALDVVRQVAEAMAQAHAAQLVHGDLKASNLMMEASGRIRILDFGLACRRDPLATQSAPDADMPGTIAYMAPERLQGKGPSPAADIYALGVVLYELLAGTLPFAQLSGLALAAAHLQSVPRQWPLPAGTRAAVAALLHAMTAEDPLLRCVSMRQVCDVIDDLQDGGAGALPSRRAAWWRSAACAWVAGLCAAAAVAAGVWWTGAPPSGDHAASDGTAMQEGMQALRLFDHAGNLDRAEARFAAVVSHQPHHAAAAAALSLVYSLRYASDGRDESWLQRADASARQALALDDQLALAYAAQAWVKEFQGRMDEALRLDERGLALDPHNLFALNGKAQVLIGLRRYADAEAVIRTAMAAHPDERWFTDLLGTLHFQQGDAVAAEQAFRRSIALDPAAAVSYANLNGALLYQHREDEALQVLQQGLAVRPDSRLYGNLGAALFARGDYAGAARAFERALSSGKGNPNYYLDWANLADALRWLPGREAESMRAYGHASELLRPLLRRDPGNPTLQSRLGVYAVKGGDRKTALPAIRAALADEEADAAVHFRAAIVWELSGERAQALAEIGRSRALGYPAHLIETEPDLLALRRDLRYHTFEKDSK
ncbi:serine/threonine-protein kinase PrkC [Janthinobacterium sp. HH01]|uniref:serine/threonine-protein kinase n=1 Tax=Janthinobacterium sp. HH01 TaxID=1198452 RepID=UPI0002AE88E5|nr:serine/threonine-protein kinase [Janthinobacterium sp. HH01]ELX09925.1 serine/threonine-protein kinase PrkC [Janthinobacterium sp. HH01]